MENTVAAYRIERSANMITLEQVDKLREKANISYEDARTALEATDGDLLEAVIFLERQGKIAGPDLRAYNTRTGGSREGGAGYGGYGRQEGHWDQPKDGWTAEAGDECHRHHGHHFRHRCHVLWHKFCGLVKRANANQFEVIKDGRSVISMPLTLLILAVLFFFWVTIPILVIALFFGFQYRFRGPDLGKDAINNVMSQAADTAENIKRSVMAESETAGESRQDGQDNR
jgi:hypothetical protein